MNKKLTLLVITAVALFGFVILIQTGNIGSTALWNVSQGGQWLLPLVVVAALIDSINPCAFSILLLTIAFLLSLGKLRSKIMKVGSAYIIGIFAAYLGIGFGIFQVLHIFNTPHFMAKIGAALLIALGALNLTHHFFPAFPIKIQIPRNVHRPIAQLMEKSSLPAAFLLGGLVGLCEFPCTGGPYLMVVGLLHDQATYAKGFGYMLLYNFVFVLPLILILLIASNKGLVEKVEFWRKSNLAAMRLSSGIAMVVLGLLIVLL